MDSPLPIVPGSEPASTSTDSKDALEATRRLREEIYLNASLTRTILHDLKNPLTVTLGHLQVMRMLEREKLTEKTLKHLNAAEESCKTQLAIIGNISDLSKYEMGALTLHPGRIDPIPVIQSQIETFTRLDSSKKFNLSILEPACAVVADLEALTRIIRNLIDNSSRHSKSGGVVSIEVSQDPINSNFVVISVIDSGETIPLEWRDSIFDRRYMNLADTPGRRADIGMGLVYSRMAARLMNGDLILANVERGARFELKLPRAHVE